MITKKKFEKLWKESGLEDYYSKMDKLGEIGFSFDKHGDMDWSENEALHEWIKNNKYENIIDADLEEIEKNFPKIKEMAKELQKAFDNL